MDAISPCRTENPDDERRARQLGMCRELAELGMEIARAFVRKAARDQAAEEATEQPGPAETQEKPARKPLSPAVILARLSREIRLIMVLENKIAAGHGEPDAPHDFGAPYSSGPEFSGPEFSGPELCGPELCGPELSAHVDGGAKHRADLVRRLQAAAAAFHPAPAAPRAA